MPVKRTYKKKRSKRSKKTALATKKYVKYMFNKELEHKWFGAEYNANIADTGTFVDFSAVTQGVGSVQRIGDKINPTTIKFDISFLAQDLTNRFRLIIFQWHPNDNADAPQIQEIISYTAGYQTQAPLNPDFREQYTLLKDDFLHFETNSLLQHRRYIFRPKRVIDYNAAGSTNGRNHIYVFMVSDSAVVPHVGVTITSMLMFTDA